MRAAAEIDRRHRQRFVHRHHEVASPIDALAIAKRLADRFAQRDADVLDGVVLIDVEIAGGVDRQIEGAVPRHEIEHVVEEADAGTVVEPAPPVERERQRDRRFRRLPRSLPLCAQRLQRLDRLRGCARRRRR